MRLSVVSLIAIASSVYASEAPIPGYGTVEIEWEFKTSDGSGPILLNGTVQEVQAFLEAEKPALVEPFLSNDTSTSSLTRRTVFNRADVICDNFPHTGPQLIWPQIDYLRRVKGQPKNGPGPGNCGRVSCEAKAAVWWCNDEKNDKTLESFGSIADGAQAVTDACSRGSTDGHAGYEVSGQAFHPTHWNVIVRKGSC